MVTLLLVTMFFADRVEVVWNVNNSDGVVQVFETADNIWNQAQGGNPKPLVFLSYDKEEQAGEVVLTVRIDSGGEFPMSFPRDFRQATIWAIPTIEDLNDGDLIAHCAEVITEWVESQGQNRTKAVVFTVPVAAAFKKSTGEIQ